jgi:hypothetical protein
MEPPRYSLGTICPKRHLLSAMQKMSRRIIVEAWLANQQLERLENYLQRGRPLSDVSLEELRTHWVALMRAWAQHVRGGIDNREREDIEAEMTLRKVEPPFDLVKRCNGNHSPQI